MFKSNIKLNNMVSGLGILAILVLATSVFPGKVAANYQAYYATENPTPFVNNITPSNARVRDSISTISITGSGFTEDSIARWNGSNKRTTFIDSNHLLIHINSNDLDGSSGRYVNVWNPGPGGGYSNAILFSINGYTPASTYIAPVADNANSYDYNQNLYTNTNNTTRTNQSNNAVSSSNSTQTNQANNLSENENNSSIDSGSNSELSTEAVKSLTASAIFGSNTFMPSGLIQWVMLGIIILLLMLVVRRLFGATDKYHSTPLKHD